MTRGRAAALVVLRTIIGWHFLYEGYFKLVVPGWSRQGAPLPAWSASGYLHGASGPFASAFHAVAESALAGWTDLLIPIALVLIGLSLTLGLFTQTGCWAALGLLTLFYLAMIPVTGVPAPNSEGAYLIVNKTLVEWAAVLVCLVFRTGEIAGVDTLLAARHRSSPASAVAVR
jgi:thiosulfate dehydrogenase (quinone) large subunit